MQNGPDPKRSADQSAAPYTAPSWAENMTVREVVDLAGITDAWDGAVLQSWFDEHYDEMQARGGWAIWVYRAGDLFGAPLFADEVFTLAESNR